MRQAWAVGIVLWAGFVSGATRGFAADATYAASTTVGQHDRRWRLRRARCRASMRGPQGPTFTAEPEGRGGRADRLAGQMAVQLVPYGTGESRLMAPNVIAVLGGPQVFGTRAADIDLVDEVERGLPKRAYEAVSEALGLTPAEEDRLLQVSLRTRARWKRRARLDPATSDRLVRLARILALAVMVLENRQNAVAWLREPSDVLGGRSPLAAIASDPGAEKVSNMLYQMEHGVYA